MSDDLMTLNEYQERARETAQYPRTSHLISILYTALGVAGEGGEIANTVKKILRDDNGVLTPEKRLQIVSEVGDVLWYCAMLSEELGFSLSVVAGKNLDKLRSRKERGKITGSGGER